MKKSSYSFKRRQKGKGRYRAGSKVLTLLFLLMLFGAGCWYVYFWIPAGIDSAADNFMKKVSAGDKEAAALLLLDQEENGAALTSLIALFQDGKFTFNSAGRSRLTGLFNGTALIYFNSGGSLYRAPLHLVRRGDGWLIAAMPEINIMTGAYIEKIKPSVVQVFYNNERIELPWRDDLQVEAGTVACVELFGDAVIIEPLDEIRLSRLLRFSDTECEGELEGILPFASPLPVYLVDPSMFSQAEQGSLKDLIVGMSDIALYLSSGIVVAARMEKGFSLQTIRVLIRQNLSQLSEESLYHRHLRLHSKEGCTLEGKQDGLLFTFEPRQTLLVEPLGGEIRVTPGELESIIFKQPIYISALEGGTVILDNLMRDGWIDRSPAYRGIMEIANQGGRLIVINELALEEYLNTVVPGEMAATFGQEALKAQAVAARTYACRSYLSSSYSCYGAHVDDSTLSQVYNNVPEHPAVTEAVVDTAGEVLFYEKQAAYTHFFSTSCGFTANCHEVWHDPITGSFPSEPLPYLRALTQIPGELFYLESEEEMVRFLEQGSHPGYDRFSPFFRWSVTMSGEQFTASINRNLAQRYREQPGFILTKEGDNYRSMEVPRNPLGKLKDIRVIRRGAGGNVMVLEVEGTNGTYRIMKEYNIRLTLRPVNYLSEADPVVLKRGDGSELLDYALLPSAFAVFNVDRNDTGEIAGVLISGGGNGHGVGMSQYGAKGMAEEGYNYREILEHYYPGTELHSLFEP